MSTHKLHTCARDCEGCVYCRGGLAFCDVCKGAEAQLPTECPGAQMDDALQEAVALGRRDFIGGAWIVKAVIL